MENLENGNSLNNEVAGGTSAGAKTFQFVKEKLASIDPEKGAEWEKGLEAAEEVVSRSIDSLAETVRKYPLQSVAVGLGVGCLIGFLLKGRD